jgi:glycosyltransferase involved in cell wall biosynthesis
MVAAEAAAAGCLPIVSRHSGLAEVAAGLEAEYPPRYGGLAGFPAGDASALRDRLETVLGLSDADRAALRAGARRAVVQRWSWAGVARQLLELATNDAS